MKPQSYYADRSKPKPYLRGVSHQIGFFFALLCSAYLLAITPSSNLLPMAIYCFGFCGMLGTSSSYHRISWTMETEIWVRRLDYVMISVMIAGCFTPFCVLAFESSYSTFVLWALWLGVLLCIFLNLIWVNSPKIFRTSVYMVLGWLGLPLFPEIFETCGWLCASIVGLSGLLHTIGGVVYAIQKPDPIPEIFGYHEIFHGCVLLAALLHYYAVLVYLT